MSESADNLVRGVDAPRLVRPLWMTGSYVNDWPEDSIHENGNYFNKCAECNADFIGHKRRWVCKKCQMEADARWEAMTEEQRQTELSKMAEALEAWLPQSRTNASMEAPNA